MLEGAGVSVSMSTVLKGRRSLGWTSRGTAYCQLVRAANREKRLRWAQEHIGASFNDVIWTDETSVQLETHRRFCCRKRGQKPRYKPRPKHPVKVHVWAGISWNGATKVCIFEGIMDAELYCQIILDGFLVPFIQTVYPLHHKFMQDNDPKHTSSRAQAFFADRGINWWRTPPESPDSNPIENMWHELKVCTTFVVSTKSLVRMLQKYVHVEVVDYHSFINYYFIVIHRNSLEGKLSPLPKMRF